MAEVKKAKKKAFIEPELVKHDSFVETTLFGGASAQGASAVGT